MPRGMRTVMMQMRWAMRTYCEYLASLHQMATLQTDEMRTVPFQSHEI